MAARERDIPTQDDIRRLLDASQSRDSYQGARSRVLVYLLGHAGLRNTSAAQAPLRNVKLDTGTIIVERSAKGGNAHAVGMSPQMIDEIRRFLPLRHRYLTGHGVLQPHERGDNLALVCTRHGTPMDRFAVRRLVRALARRAGFNVDNEDSPDFRRFYPHGLRGAAATFLVERGIDLPTVQDQLGHTSLRHTRKYMRALAAADLADAMRQAHTIQPHEALQTLRDTDLDEEQLMQMAAQVVKAARNTAKFQNAKQFREHVLETVAGDDRNPTQLGITQPED